MYVLKTDVNANVPIMQSDNLHSLTGTIFLLLKDNYIIR